VVASAEQFGEHEHVVRYVSSSAEGTRLFMPNCDYVALLLPGFLDAKKKPQPDFLLRETASRPLPALQ